jgi:predicted nucleotidyltransferase
MSQEKLDQLLTELKAGLTKLYGNRLFAVYLFGSYARNDQDYESDLDILIILTSINHYRAEIEHTGYLASNLSLKYGVSISRNFLTKFHWEEADSSLLRNIHAEAIAA